MCKLPIIPPDIRKRIINDNPEKTAERYFTHVIALANWESFVTSIEHGDCILVAAWYICTHLNTCHSAIPTMH